VTQSDVNITYSKPPIPLVWLDTWVFIKIAQAKAGEIKGDEGNQLLELFRLLLRLRERRLLICPETGHDIEVEAGGHLVDETRRVMAQVSAGIHTHYAHSRSSQVLRAIGAYAHDAKGIELPWTDLFPGDPLEKLTRDGPVVRVTIPVGREGLASVGDANQRLAAALEDLRRSATAKRETFEYRLNIELTGVIEATVQIFESFERKMSSGTLPDFDEVLRYSDEVGRYLRAMDREIRAARGGAGDLRDLLSFYRSSYYTELPTVRIFAELYATKITGSEGIKPSDPMDMNQIAALLPFANYMLLDGAMRDKVVQQRKLDVRYSANVVSTVRELTAALSR
jgi:hypothetical protein